MLVNSVIRIFPVSGVSSSFYVAASGREPLPADRDRSLQVEYPESLFDGTFHIGGESALQTGVRHVRIQIRDAVRIIEEPVSYTHLTLPTNSRV